MHLKIYWNSNISGLKRILLGIRCRTWGHRPWEQLLLARTFPSPFSMATVRRERTNSPWFSVCTGTVNSTSFQTPAHRIPLRPERVVNINQLMLQLPSCEGKTLLVAQTATYQMDEFMVTLRNSTWRNFHGWAQTAPSPLPDSKDTAPCSPPGHQKDNWTHFPGGLDVHSGYPLHPSNARLHCNRSSSQILLPKCQSVQKGYSPFHCYLFHNYVMMFLIALFILLLLWCYLFCNKQHPHPTRCCVAQKPAFLGSHDERIVFCLWVSLKKKEKKKEENWSLAF